MSEKEEPEEKFKTLINIGIGFSILLIIGIFITIGVTKQKIVDRPEFDEDEYERLRDSVYAADYLVDDYDYYDDPGDYYDNGAYPIESENDSLRDLIRSDPYGGAYKDELLDHLESEADACTKLIREIVADLGDTMSQPGVRGTGVSIDFFSRTERDEVLFSKLFAYREKTEDLAEDAGLYDAVTYRDYLPLRETSTYGYVKTWDESEFEKDPVDVMNYLKNLEVDVRQYENQVLWDMWY